MFNQTGQMTHYLDLLMARGNKKIKERFYVTGLSGVELILGYPWLRDFNPQIDWPTNKLLGLGVQISTLLYARYPHLSFLLKNGGMGINHAELVAQRAEPVPIKTQPPSEHPKEQTIEEQVPERYHKYLDIFAKPVAGQLPPHHKWDLKVRLLPNAPASISCVPYQLSRVEQEFQSQYIKENLARGFIRKSSSPYSTPVFYNRKKDGGFRPLFNYRKINAITVKDVSPLPRINTILKDTIGATLFSKFDLREGYYNVAVEEESQDILAFKTTEGLYAPMVMNHVFQPLYDAYGP